MNWSEPAVLRGRARYERVMEGWVDNTDADAFTHTVTLSDPDRAVEVAVVALPSPTYAIREARCRVLTGAVALTVVEGVRTLGGTPMVGGLTRRVAEATGAGEGAGLVLDAVIEIARLARQVAKLPPERAARAAGGDAWECCALRDPCDRDAHAARPLQPSPGPAPRLRAKEDRAARARRPPPAALSLHARQRPRVRDHL